MQRGFRKVAIAKLRALLQRQADPNVRTSLGETPLLLAARSEFPEAFEVLLEYGADLTSTARSGMSVAAAAAAEGSLRSLEKLYNLSIPINWTDTFLLKTARSDFFPDGYLDCNVLHAAAALEDSSVLKYLATIPALSSKLDGPTKFGFTPLHLAAGSGSVDNIEFLLQNGANVNALGTPRVSPLHLALCNGHAKVVSLLINSEISLLPDGYGRSPEDLARLSGSQEMTSIIQTARSTAFEQIKSHSQLLRKFKQAIRHGDVEVCRAFMKQGVLNLGPLTCGCTPLIHALNSGHSDVANLILHKGASTAGTACTTHSQKHFPSAPPYRLTAARIAVHMPELNEVLPTLLEKCLLFGDHWAWSSVNLVHVAVDVNHDAIDIIKTHLENHWEWYM
jgi:ankyrin